MTNFDKDRRREVIAHVMAEWRLVHDAVASFWLDVAELKDNYLLKDSRTHVLMVQPYVDEDGAFFYITGSDIVDFEPYILETISLDDFLAGPTVYFAKWCEKLKDE